MTTDAYDVRGKSIGKSIRSNNAHIQRKFLLTIAYKSMIIRFKMDEDPLQRWIYFLTFVELLKMTFSPYTQTCEVLLDYPKIGGDNIKDFEKKVIRNLLHANIDVNRRRLIAVFPANGIKYIEICNHIVQT